MRRQQPSPIQTLQPTAAQHRQIALKNEQRDAELLLQQATHAKQQVMLNHTQSTVVKFIIQLNGSSMQARAQVALTGMQMSEKLVASQHQVEQQRGAKNDTSAVVNVTKIGLMRTPKEPTEKVKAEDNDFTPTGPAPGA